jgi:hypothetical protein
MSWLVNLNVAKQSISNGSKVVAHGIVGFSWIAGFYRCKNAKVLIEA